MPKGHHLSLSPSLPLIQASAAPLLFLKLGGSLITDKDQPHTVREETLRRLAEEIREALAQRPEIRLVLGHGSGSFGHVPASKYGTRLGVHTREEWLGFVEVWQEAIALNRFVMQALAAAKLPAIALPPSASTIAQDGQVVSWGLEPLQAALQAGLLPVVFGDVVFDRQRGGTILSTEDQFTYLAQWLRPQRLLLAGIEPGVWADYPACTTLISSLTPQSLAENSPTLLGSASTDVTGGMASKVTEMITLVQSVPDLEVMIFSGLEPGAVKRAMLGERMGTTITTGDRG